MKTSRNMGIRRRGAPVLALALLAGCSRGSATAEDAAGGSEATPTAKVLTAPAMSREVPEIVEAFGSAVPDAGGVITLSVPLESRVRRVLVTEGTPVAEGEPLLEIEPSPESDLALTAARDDLAAATEQRRMIEERLASHLSTRQELLQAEQRQRAAEIKEKNLERRGEAHSVLRSRANGVVFHVGVQPGQIVAPGTALVDVVSRGQIAIRLGVESTDVTRVRSGQPVGLRRTDGSDALVERATVGVVAQAVNHETRLVDVTVRPKHAGQVTLGQYMRGEIEVGRHAGLVVPRAAILPEEDHALVFTIEGGRAVRHVVHVGRDDGRDVEVLDAGIEPGVPVVVQGAAELTDGMPVESEHGR